MTPDEVRLLDNKYALLFIRGERPIMDLKYDILKHPNVEYTTDGKGKPYIHGGTERSVASIMISNDTNNVDYSDIQELENMEDIENYELLTNEEVEERIMKGEL